MKSNRADILGSFDGYISNIKAGKNIKGGTLIYTRMHEDAHKILQESTEIGWILYFLRRDSECAAENKDFGYCNKLNAFINVMEQHLENISEIFANTCELLAVNENGISVKSYIDGCKKEKYGKYCFLFEYVNGLGGALYEKIDYMLYAAKGSLQQYEVDFVKIGLSDGVSKLKERLSSCEYPEITLQRILYGQIQYKKKEIDLYDVLHKLESVGVLVYIQDYISLLKDRSYMDFVNESIDDKELQNFLFHMKEKYFDWSEIHCKTVSQKIFVGIESYCLAIHSDGKDEVVAFKFIDNGEIYKGYFCDEDLDRLISTVKCVMYDVGSEEKLINNLKKRKNVVLLEFYNDVYDYWRKIVVCGKYARFISVSDSEDYAVSYGGLTCQNERNIIYFSIYNGMYNSFIYELVRKMGGETFCMDEIDGVLPDDLFLSYSFAMVFCLKATS